MVGMQEQKILKLVMLSFINTIIQLFNKIFMAWEREQYKKLGREELENENLKKRNSELRKKNIIIRNATRLADKLRNL